MNNKSLVWGILIIIVAIVLWLTLGGSQYKDVAAYGEDTTLEGALVVEDGERITVADGATLTIDGDLTVNGALECDGGALSVVVTGETVINDRLACERGENLDDDDLGLGISLVAQGGLTFGENSEIESDGHVQFVDDADNLATTQAELDALYDAVDTVPPNGTSIGPFLDNNDAPVVEPVTKINKHFSFSSLLPAKAHAQAAFPVLISGKLKVKTPRKGIKQIIVYYFPNASGITIKNFTLSGPDGRNGTEDKGGNCTAKATDGEDAFKFNAFAPNLTVNNFTLNLGNGGDGGDAETGNDCKPGVATGGDGGNSGNFRMTAGNKFQIDGAFVVNPGYGGAGGNATAHGKNGGASEDGGDASATAGAGADNKKSLSITGTVGGSSNIQITDIVGGEGGWASANPGTGGDGLSCGDKGGDGGSGSATGGKGGDASFSGSGRAPLAQDIGGTGGGADATGANGGNGGSCDATGPGGNGGDGGDAGAEEGKGGSGNTGPSADGIVLDETGGNGGNGGDGCDEGVGGSGGVGDPKGDDGEDGKNLCLLTPPEENYTSPPQEETISVIQWMDYYIPIDQLFIVPGHEPYCSEDHWHTEGIVVTVQGGTTGDPDPQNCGFGKVSEVPVMEIPIE